MEERTGRLSYHSSRHCFISLPRTWTTKLSKEKLTVLEVQGENGSVYTTWAGSTTDGEVLEINGLFGIKQKLEHGDEVLVRALPSVPVCSQVYLEPVSPDDWEILEDNTEYIETNLLNQLRVVWSGQVIPIWLRKSICVFMTIGITVPKAKCCIIQENTEVIVAPKSRQGLGRKPKPKQDKIQEQPSTSVEPDPSPVSDIPDRIQSPLNDDLNEVPLGVVHKTSQIQIRARFDGKLTEVPPDENTVDIIEESEKPNPEASGMIKKTMNYIRDWWYPETQEIPKPKVNLEKLLPGIFDSNLRTLSLDDLLQKTNPEIMHLLIQPVSTILLSHSTFRKHFHGENDGIIPKSFIARLSKLLSPLDKLEGNVADNLKSTASETSKKKESMNELLSETKASSVAVRVVITEYNDQLPDSAIIMNNIQDDTVYIHDTLRALLSLVLGDRVRITAATLKPESPSQIDFYPIFIPPKGYTPSMIYTAIQSWRDVHLDQGFPLIINPSTLVKVPLNPEFKGTFVVSYPHDGDQTYALLVDKIDLKEPLKSKQIPECLRKIADDAEIIDLPIPKMKLDNLGGLANYSSRMTKFVDIALQGRPLTRRIFKNTISSTFLLVCGQKGIGKTAISRALCRYASESPNMASVATMECKSLKGKRIEVLRKILEKVIGDAIWRQPAVVLLDDLDHIASAPQGPEMEMSGEAQYYTKVAEMIKTLLDMILERRARVLVIATSTSGNSLHQSLLASRGKHYFQESVEITTPSLNERLAILAAILQRKPVKDNCVNLDLSEIAVKMEGFVAKDMDMLIDRAIHQHHMKNPDKRFSSSDGVPLGLVDFTEALEGFVPVALKNVALHNPGELSWGNIGGLDHVKKTLVEMVQWPSKYPKLFGSCPLRQRSGMLLFGAPGTGKTLMAAVAAAQCKLNFITVKGPELLSKYIGASEQGVRDVFHRAQSAKPCILFFDEFDSLAPRRGHDSTGVTDRVVNQLLTQLDGVESLEGVFVLGATSRPDLIDPALLRPGRLDKTLHCPIPESSERLDILKTLTANIPLDPDIKLEDYSGICENFTGADFKALLYNAQLEAIHGLQIEEDEETEETQIVHIRDLDQGSTWLTSPPEHSNQWLPAAKPTEKGAPEIQSPIITEEHLQKALEGMGPSVSREERMKYRNIYDNFLGKGNPNQQLMGQRATLA